MEANKDLLPDKIVLECKRIIFKNNGGGKDLFETFPQNTTCNHLAPIEVKVDLRSTYLQFTLFTGFFAYQIWQLGNQASTFDYVAFVSLYLVFLFISGVFSSIFGPRRLLSFNENELIFHDGQTIQWKNVVLILFGPGGRHTPAGIELCYLDEDMKIKRRFFHRKNYRPKLDALFPMLHHCYRYHHLTYYEYYPGHFPPH